MFKIKKSNEANIPITIRFTENLYAELKKFAKNNNISFNSLVLQCCEYAFKNTEENKK